MTVAIRLLTSGLATALGQWVLAVGSLLAMGLEPITWWLGLSGALTAVVSVWVFRLVRPASDDGDGDSDYGGGGGGGGGPEDPPDPPWWPEFERAFREHAARPRAGAHAGGQVLP